MTPTHRASQAFLNLLSSGSATSCPPQRCLQHLTLLPRCQNQFPQLVQRAKCHLPVYPRASLLLEHPDHPSQRHNSTEPKNSLWANPALGTPQNRQENPNPLKEESISCVGHTCPTAQVSFWPGQPCTSPQPESLEGKGFPQEGAGMPRLVPTCSQRPGEPLAARRSRNPAQPPS